METTTPALVCNCAAKSPTMPTCRDKHLADCPAAILDFLAEQSREGDEIANGVEPNFGRARHDRGDALRSWHRGYAYAMRLAAQWLVSPTRDNADLDER